MNGPLVVLYGVWAPVLRAFAIHEPEVSDEIVNASRSYPDAAMVQTLAGRELRDSVLKLENANFTRIAEDLLRGEVNVKGYPKRKIRMPFDGQAAFEGNSHWQLAYASFLVPQIFLEAFIETGRGEFLRAGLDFIFGWADFERLAWNAESFIWNDHAAAVRSDVIADFWYRYKMHESFTVDGGRKLLKMAARTTDFLARDINYTFRTNHGTMQSIAVLKMVAFFPEITTIQKSKQISVNNLIEQFGYFINPEGIILEHSAGYHAFGLNLISAAFRLFEALRIEVPADWTEKYQRGLEFLVALRRPDGTLPKLGDTNELVDSGSYWRPARELTFAPGAGYAIWWSGLGSWPQTKKLNQTAVTWSFFPFMGHKHADELSFTLWKGGQEWWTNVGYWPYTDHRRKVAVSWSGSNAPHLVGESWSSVRRSSVLAWSENETVKAIDLVRRGPDGFRVRRQILSVGDSVWITLDYFEDTQERRGRVVWGLHPSLKAREQDSPRTFRVVGDRTDLEMDVFFRGSDGIRVLRVHGSSDPMAGWMATGQTILPADAFIVDQHTGNGWVATVSIVGVRNVRAGSAGSVDVQWSGPEQWIVDIARQDTVLTVRRSADTLLVSNAFSGGLKASARMELVSENEQSQGEIADAYFKAEMKHGKRFLPLISYRQKVTVALSVLFMINTSAIISCLIVSRRRTVQISALSLCSFGLLYLWLMNYYFVLS